MLLFRIVQQQAELHALAGKLAVGEAAHTGEHDGDRHLLGSQIFDYWFDPDGLQFEHYTDGDVFTADFETHYSEFDLGSIWAWGVDIPPAMKPRMSPAVLWRVLKLVLAKKLAPQRLKLFGQAIGIPARPWM